MVSCSNLLHAIILLFLFTGQDLRNNFTVGIDNKPFRKPRIDQRRYIMVS